MSGPTLVTGAGGFLGGHIVGALAARGEAVRAFDLAFPAPLPEGVARIEGSILDADALARAADGAAAIIHCAAITDLWQRRPILYDRVNTRGTCEVLVAARRAGARMVQVSSYLTLVARDEPGGRTLDERVEVPPTRLLGPYPRTKREAELFCLAAAAQGLDVVIVLPSAPVGPGDWRLTPPSRMIRDLAAQRLPALIDCLMNLVDVRALAAGVIAARDHGRAGRRYLLSGADLPIGEVAAKVAAAAGVAPPRRRVPWALAVAAARAEAGLARLTGRAPRTPLTGVALAGKHVRFSNARAREELGFAPPAVDAALAEAVAWMRAQGLLS